MTFAQPYIAAAEIATASIGAFQAAHQESIEHSKPHMRSDLRGRASAVLAVIRECTASLVGYLLASSIDVATISHGGILGTWLLFGVFFAAEKGLWWVFQWPFFGQQADAIERELP